MKKMLLLFVMAFLSTMFAMAQEIVMECTYSSNQSYKTLIVINDTGGEAMSVAGDKKCHYDIEVEAMGDHIIILAHNASLSGWVDDIYIISDEDKCFVVSPGMSDGNNFAKIEVEPIEDESEIKAKKREYGLLNYRGAGQGGDSSRSR